MKKIISFLVVLIMMVTTSRAAEPHWATANINFLTEKGVLQKVFDIKKIDEIKNNAITREEFLTLMAVANDTVGSEPKIKLKDFDTVKKEYAPYIGRLINDGIIAGIPENGDLYIKPLQKITRQEASVVLYKMLKITDANFEIKFADNSNVGPWAKKFMNGVVKNKLMNGYPDNTIKPQNNITIAEAITIVANAYDKGFFADKTAKKFAGTGDIGLEDGKRDSSSFAMPNGMVFYKDKLYIADTGNNVIRSIERDKVSVLAGEVKGRNEYLEAIGSFRDGGKAFFDKPSYIVATKNGFLITDKGNNLVRLVSSGYTTTYAGKLTSGMVNGKVGKARFNGPTGIAVDSESNVYIADTGNNVIRMIDKDKNVTTFAGVASKDGGYKDGNALNAEFNSPMGLAIFGGALYVADCGNQRIRMIKDGQVTTVAGIGTEKEDSKKEIVGGFVDGDNKTAMFNFPTNIIADNTGVLYVADTGNGAIRKISVNGNVETIKAVGIKKPSGLALNRDTLYVADMFKNIIFEIDL